MHFLSFFRYNYPYGYSLLYSLHLQDRRLKVQQEGH